MAATVLRHRYTHRDTGTHMCTHTHTQGHMHIHRDTKHRAMPAYTRTHRHIACTRRDIGTHMCTHRDTVSFGVQTPTWDVWM